MLLPLPFCPSWHRQPIRPSPVPPAILAFQCTERCHRLHCFHASLADIRCIPPPNIVPGSKVSSTSRQHGLPGNYTKPKPKICTPDSTSTHCRATYSSSSTGVIPSFLFVPLLFRILSYSQLCHHPYPFASLLLISSLTIKAFPSIHIQCCSFYMYLSNPLFLTISLLLSFVPPPPCPSVFSLCLPIHDILHPHLLSPRPQSN